MTRTAAQTAIAAHGRHWPAGVAMLTVPGLYGSGPGHWQSRWEERFPDWRRVEQDDWSTPDLARWSARVGQAVRAAQAERRAGDRAAGNLEGRRRIRAAGPVIS
ncbi:alpha/beta hydrolase, partial [Ralstonia pseudosolanacearum]|uniref:alpha/beta hydrolase n=1 Tax=Ralstonia pseudosolanacearum TaxID=1310165 RepID=UPI003CF26F1C